ncbi:MAG TPA: trypsin-like peptidase domain-containing protein [Gammaproteobacteria bacterium]|nr:trypsin-like peptidase domain-containing protein [Gammaproteobacteria bacterium]HQY22284.1 trypsin-like peptidase domain-containing protein [Gammaproteobacteria bacterium]HRA42282.1 trypsin-like peptidase domain-containing protein [Gammaproteobacteria bacterium]
MKIAKRAKKVVKLILFFGLITLLSPFILAKLNFYGPSHATTPASANTTISSVTLNAPVSYADAVALAAPAVVSIKTTQEVTVDQNPLMQDPMFRYFFGEQNGGQGNGEWNGNEKNKPGNEQPKETLQGLGSGVIISEKGYVLTNNHVIREADTVIVTLADGRSADGKVVGTDPDSDLAVLKINLDKLPVITLGSSQKLRAGDVVLAIGNPYGLDKTVTLGIISATERAGTDVGILENLLQTDAAINPGNSGGALINSFGQIIGINTVIYSRSGGNQGIGFAIPIDQATEVMNKLIEGKPIIRGYLGIMMQPINKEIRGYIDYKEGDGVYVRAVVRGSPAQKAGLLPGDVIIKINNTVITDERMALRLVSGLIPGKNYPLEIFRKGEYLSFIVTPSERKPAQPKRKE